MSLTAADAIEMAGGHVTFQSCPSVFPHRQLAEVSVTFQGLSDQYHALLEAQKRDDAVVMALVHSPRMLPEVQPLPSGEILILVPLGLPARIRVLARLLLRYWGKETRTTIIQSPLDDVPSAIPDGLKPIFTGEGDPATYWDALGELDESTELDPAAEQDVGELVYLSLAYLLSHEFTHVLHGHLDLLERSQTEDLGITQDRLLRGLELDADGSAAALAMKVVHAGVQAADPADVPGGLPLAWLRLSYAVTMVLAMVDAHRHYVGAYDTGSYNHPMIRREIFKVSAVRSIDAPNDAVSAFQAQEQEGWLRCVFALNDLTLEATSGAFGGLPPGQLPGQPHSMTYSSLGSALMADLTDRLDRALKLMTEVRLLLPIFAHWREDS